jgi:predicted amidohydrolase YtcJ
MAVTVYSGGDILTMDDGRPAVEAIAVAVAVADGLILAVGDRESATRSSSTTWTPRRC